MKPIHSIILVLALVLGTVGLAPTASSQQSGFVGCQCDGDSYPNLSYHPCVDLVALATSIWPGQCGTPMCEEKPCNYIVSLYIEYDVACGGGSGSFTQNSSIECDSTKNFLLEIGGNHVASVLFVCGQCPINE